MVLEEKHAEQTQAEEAGGGRRLRGRVLSQVLTLLSVKSPALSCSLEI